MPVPNAAMSCSGVKVNLSTPVLGQPLPELVMMTRSRKYLTEKARGPSRLDPTAWILRLSKRPCRIVETFKFVVIIFVLRATPL